MASIKWNLYSPVGLGVSSFIAILTRISYRWKNPNLGPLVLLCSTLITELAALVYSLTPNDLYGTSMPTCYTNLTEEIWNSGKARITISYKHASCVSVGAETSTVRLDDKSLRQTVRRLVNRLCKMIFSRSFDRDVAVDASRYVTNGSGV